MKWVCRPVGADNEYVFARYLGVGREVLAELEIKNVV